MEKHLPFHQQLKRERELRGWTQADLASQLQIDTKTVNRWENSKRLPQPYHRQHLCTLFGKNAEELGLLEIEEQDTGSFLSELVPQEDWGEAPGVRHFYGRNAELTMLKQWIVEDHCRLVAVLGMGGVGKTTLSSELAKQVKDEFEYVFWRSLHNAPPLEHILKQCLQFISGQNAVNLPAHTDEQLSLLMQALREHRCLLIFDNIESLLQAGQRAGQYRVESQNYGILIQRVGETQHSSCLVLTSREKTQEIARLEGKRSPVRSLHLPGIGYPEGQELLKEKELVGTSEQWRTLVKLYSGNPLALKLVSEVIEGIFGGSIAAFLAAEQISFGDINDLLDQQFQRLSSQEQEILYWLAIEREAITLESLRGNFIHSLPMGTFLEALTSLQRRSLLEVREMAHFMLQPVIMEYMTDRLTTQLFEEFTSTTFESWMKYALIKARSKDYIRESQVHFILDPLADQLLDIHGKESIEQRVQQMLNMQRRERPHLRNYLAGNALNLLIHIHSDMRGVDFSSLMIWQAYLQNVTLPEINFTHAHFMDTVFTNTFGNILSVTFSSHGQLLAMGTAAGDIWLYHVSEERPLHIYHGHTDGVWAVAFSPNGQLLASSSDDQSIRLWDVNTGQCLQTLTGHTNRVRSLALNQDATMLASGSDDRTIRLWDVNTGQCLHTLTGHTDRVWSVSFSPDYTLLASGSTDGTVRLWDMNIRQCIRTLHGHTDGIRSVAFSPDGNLLASGSNDQTIRLWNVSSGQCSKVLNGHTNRVWSVAFSLQGDLLASGSEDRTVRLWGAQNWQCLHILQNHSNGVRSVAFSPDGQMLASGGDDQTVRLWSVEDGYCLKTLQGYTNRMWSIAFASAGQRLVSSNEDQTIRIWDVDTGACLHTFREHTHGVRAIAIDGRTIASGGEDLTIRLWDIMTGNHLSTLRGHGNWVWTIAFSPDGTVLASGSEDQTVRLWDVQSGQCLFTLAGHTSWVRSVTFSHDGNTLASGGDDQVIKLWDRRTGYLASTLTGHTNRVRAVAFSPDGQLLASSSEDRSIRLWEVKSGHCLRILEGHTNWVRPVAFHPDGQMLASGSEDHTIRLWEVGSGRCLHTLQGHSNRVRSLKFSTGGQWLASGGDDGLVLLWDISTRQLIRIFKSDRPYERMNISGATGLTEAQKTTLKLLGAIEADGTPTGSGGVNHIP